jgi:hypothetical protein
MIYLRSRLKIIFHTNEKRFPVSKCKCGGTKFIVKALAGIQKDHDDKTAFGVI